jgi:hypothetical protein
MTNHSDVQCLQAKPAWVSYRDCLLDDKRQAVGVTMLEDGITVLLEFTDADGVAHEAPLTPALSAAIRAALALSDLPPDVKVSQQ